MVGFELLLLAPEGRGALPQFCGAPIYNSLLFAEHTYIPLLYTASGRIKRYW